MPTYLASHPDFERHPAAHGHPDRPERLMAIHRVLDAMNMAESTIPIHAEAVGDEPLLACHAPELLTTIAQACAHANPVAPLGLDTVVGPDSDYIARLAVGHVLAACDAVLADPSPHANAFCMIRPPGHHATRDLAMGFCLYNHAAIAARYLQQRHGLERILVIDWDVHHGNGTEEILYDDPRSFYISTHQHPYYPDTGDPDRRGGENAPGLNLNIPLEAGSGDMEALIVLEEDILPAAREFAPDFILISAGFDAHARDPMGLLEWHSETYGTYTDAMTELARDVGSRGIVSILEGGYDLLGLADAALLHLRRLIHASSQG